MTSIAVIGTGYVGLITGAGFADLGNDVVCVDILEEKIAKLRAGTVPFFEPGLEELTRRTADAGRLRFTTDYEQAIPAADFVFITVDTPPGGNGKADMSRVESAARSLAPHLRGRTIIINKSTMPIGGGDFVAQIIREYAPSDADFAVVSNPEFLREGSAVRDVREPDRIVLGGDDAVAVAAVAELYETVNAPIVKTDLRTAEMIKYASNAMLATRISFINEIAAICEEFNADVRVVARGMGLDTRIGPSFLEAGIGFGGSCFPKDVKALAYMAAEKQLHPQLLNSVLDINQDQRRRFARKTLAQLSEPGASTVGIWGLAFKQDTDDMREAPSVDIVRCLLEGGVRVRAYDPVAMPAARGLLPEVVYCDDPYEAALGTDALLLLTPWNEFRQANMERVFETMRNPVVLDGRNIYDRRELEALGFTYVGVGR
ncbi:MAG: UDP-glucose/GDP-mannose dehydrogenase family protein [Thermomicrobia bacterium]|nr:UDP-glucose/GDP-mannose dehydrogenase family protein [Thermomicrobia bacterium]MCA1724722.1 UDP-glucose/GDP-mannose dehydrogenase family protein [Thermomicrobia bacterium]